MSMGILSSLENPPRETDWTGRDMSRVVERRVLLRGSSFFAAIECGKFDDLHPEIKCPPFGNSSPRDACTIQLRPLQGEVNDRHGGIWDVPYEDLALTELADYVYLNPEDAETPLFALGEGTAIRGRLCYPYVIIKDGRRSLRLWCVERGWPVGARALVRVL